MKEILLCNLDSIPDKKYEILGFISAMDYERYTTEPVTEKLTKKAENLNADAIINLKFNITAHDNNALLLLSGTAIKFVD